MFGRTPTPTLDPIRRRRLRLRRFAVVGTAGTVLVGGAAFAYWTSTGSGSGTGTSSTTSPVTVNQTSAITNLNPGRAYQTLSGTFTVPSGNGSAYVTSVTASIASVTKANGAVAGTCDATDYTLTNATMAVGVDEPEGTGVGSWSGARISFNDKTSNQDQCKGATVTFSYTTN